MNKFGWSDNSIKIAANELGYSHSLSAMLPNGPVDLIYHTMDKWNEKLRKDLEGSNLSKEERVVKALKLRLSYETPVINTWAQAMKMGMSPENIKSTFDRLVKLVDIICSFEEAGITSNDNSHSKPGTNYSRVKRYLIMKMFILSELHLLTDRSANFENTWDFVDKVYWINFNLYSTLSRFYLVNSAMLTMIKYSLIAFAPYDYSKLEEMMRVKEDGS